MTVPARRSAAIKKIGAHGGICCPWCKESANTAQSTISAIPTNRDGARLGCDAPALVAASAPAYNRSVKGDLRKRIMSLRFRAKLAFAWRVFRDPHTPIVAKAVIPVVVAYLAMPLDIIPDFIPVIGQLDDLLVVAAGLGLVLMMTPRHVIEDHLSALE